MGRRPSIDAAKGQALILAYQRLGSKRAAARAVGVSQPAASRFLQSLPRAVAPAIAEQRQLLPAVVDLLQEVKSTLTTNVQRLEAQLAVYDQELRQRPGSWHAAERYDALQFELREQAGLALDCASFLVDVEAIRQELEHRR